MLRGEARTRRPGMPHSLSRSRVPVYRSAGLSSMELGRAHRDRFEGQNRRFRAQLSAARDRRNLGAVAPAHQDAILGFAEFGDAHGKPYSDRGQCDGEGEGGEVRQHAVTKIVRFLPRPLIARQAVGFLAGVRLRRAAGRVRRGTRPEPEHAVLVIRTDWPLGFHCCRSEAS